MGIDGWGFSRNREEVAEGGIGEDGDKGVGWHEEKRRREVNSLLK